MADRWENSGSSDRLYFLFPCSYMNVRAGPLRRLTAELLMLLKCGAGKDALEFLVQQDLKPVNPKGNQA